MAWREPVPAWLGAFRLAATGAGGRAREPGCGAGSSVLCIPWSCARLSRAGAAPCRRLWPRAARATCLVDGPVWSGWLPLAVGMGRAAAWRANTCLFTAHQRAGVFMWGVRCSTACCERESSSRGPRRSGGAGGPARRTDTRPRVRRARIEREASRDVQGRDRDSVCSLPTRRVCEGASSWCPMWTATRSSSHM